MPSPPQNRWTATSRLKPNGKGRISAGQPGGYQAPAKGLAAKGMPLSRLGDHSGKRPSSSTDWRKYSVEGSCVMVRSEKRASGLG
jgi:hypothetical protein